MGSQNFSEWLFSAAGAGWVVALIMIIGLILTWLFRKRPQRIYCEEIDRTSLILIDEEIREKIAVFFNKKPVDKLSQIRLALINKGSEVVNDIKLTFEFGHDTKVLDASFESSTGVHGIEKKIKGNKIVVNIPFLNPIRPHKHKIKLSILCDGLMGGLHVTGYGEGWSVTSYLLARKRQYIIRAGILAGIMLLIANVAALLKPQVGHYFGSYYNVFQIVPAIVFLAILFYTFIRFKIYRS